MNTKRIALLILVLVVVAILIGLLRPKSNSVENSSPEPQSHVEETGSSKPPPVGTSRENAANTSSPEAGGPAMPSQAVLDAAREYVDKLRADPLYNWKQTINFYGKVVDENESPLAGANVHFGWNSLNEQDEIVRLAETVISNEQGLFSLTSKRGKRLFVEVSKEGYYALSKNQLAFEYAIPYEGLFTPDSSNPVIYHLRKRGRGTDLITSQYGVKDYFGVTVSLEGTPVQVDMLERKVGQGPMTISQTKPPYETWKQATEWAFRLEIPGGGFVEQNDEFAFEAPASGYQPSVEFNFQKGQTNWTTNLSKDYYVKFGNPPRYGRLHLETSIMMSGARLTYVINPDGSRYLESK